MWFGLSSQTFWTAVQAVGTVGALVLVLWQLHKTQQQIQVTRDTAGYDLLFRLNERFESLQTRKKRSACAAVLTDALNRAPAGERPDDFWEQNSYHVRAVLDEFELMGLLLRRKVVDDQAMWTLFCYWVVNYYAYCTRTGYLQWERDTPTAYEDFVLLYQAMQAINVQREGEEDEAAEGFLKEELSLG